MDTNYFEDMADIQLVQLYRDLMTSTKAQMMEQSDSLQDALSFYRRKYPTISILMFANEMYKEMAERWMKSQPN